jgi:cobaltochelatase CobT
MTPLLSREIADFLQPSSRPALTLTVLGGQLAFRALGSNSVTSGASRGQQGLVGMLRWLFRQSQPEDSSARDQASDSYKIYTRKYDEVISAGDLLGRHPLAAVAARAAHEFQATMVARTSALTTKAILAAGEARQDPAFREGGLITLLIDLSGSMRGLNAQLATFAAEAVAAFAEAHGSRLEILGFTTVDWHGKPARADWLRSRRAENPGRLCALRHVVLSTFSDRNKRKFDLLFAPEFFRENVDGEAIEWALERLRAEQGAYRLLILASDGAPVDDSTLSCNPPDFLWAHLKTVLAKAQNDGDVHLAAIGIQHDVAQLVPGSISVRDFHEIESAIIPYLSESLRAAMERATGNLQSQ